VTTPIQSLTFGSGDLLVVMEPSQAAWLQQVYKLDNQCTLIGLWAIAARPYMHDPYGASKDYFDNCFHYIEKAVHGIFSKIRAAKESG